MPLANDNSMRKIYILLAFLIALMNIGDGFAQRTRSKKNNRSTAVLKKKSKRHSHRKRGKTKRIVPKQAPKPNPRLLDPNYDPYLLCEDTCNHVHGIDLSHYQGQVYWETVGRNTKMAYVYLKATEGGDKIDEYYERNIELAHRYGLMVGSYHFFRPKTPLYQQLENFRTQCRPGEQDLIPMIDVETTGGLPIEIFCEQLIRFLIMVEREYNQKPLIYTYRNFYNKYLTGMLDDYKLMIAMYLDEEPELLDGRDITMWQYTSKGRVMGISGYVDKSRFMGHHGIRDIRFHHYYE